MKRKDLCLFIAITLVYVLGCGIGNFYGSNARKITVLKAQIYELKSQLKESENQIKEVKEIASTNWELYGDTVFHYESMIQRYMEDIRLEKRKNEMMIRFIAPSPIGKKQGNQYPVLTFDSSVKSYPTFNLSSQEDLKQYEIKIFVDGKEINEKKECSTSESKANTFSLEFASTISPISYDEKKYHYQKQHVVYVEFIDKKTKEIILRSNAVAFMSDTTEANDNEFCFH